MCLECASSLPEMSYNLLLRKLTMGHLLRPNKALFFCNGHLDRRASLGRQLNVRAEVFDIRGCCEASQCLPLSLTSAWPQFRLDVCSACRRNIWQTIPFALRGTNVQPFLFSLKQIGAKM